MIEKRVNFSSGKDSLVGNLFIPSGDKSSRFPAVVFSGAMTQIKEQVGAIYGSKLAEKGYLALAFDPSGFGESSGEIRNYDNPMTRMENIRDSISFLGTLPNSDAANLFGLGLCASGSFVATVAVTDKRLKAIATVSGMMSNTAAFFEDVPKEQVVEMIKNANAARQKAYESGEIDYIDIMGLESLDLARLDKDSVRYGAHDFYMTNRGGAEKYPNYSYLEPAFTLETFPLSNAIPLAKYLYTPYLGIYGEKADTAVLTKSYFDKCSEPKEIYEISGANHIDLYDIDEYVDEAVDKIVEFYNKYIQTS